MSDTPPIDKIQQIRDLFGTDADWIVPALQRHVVIDDLTAMEFVDLNDEALSRWMDNAVSMSNRRMRLDLRWDLARSLREEFEKPPRAFSEESRHVVAALLEGMLLLDDFETQLCAAYVLSVTGRAASTAVPVLISALRKRDLSIKYSAVVALGDIGPAAQEALPRLLSIADNYRLRDNKLARAAGEAARKINR